MCMWCVLAEQAHINTSTITAILSTQTSDACQLSIPPGACCSRALRAGAVKRVCDGSVGWAGCVGKGAARAEGGDGAVCSANPAAVLVASCFVSANASLPASLVTAAAAVAGMAAGGSNSWEPAFGSGLSRPPPSKKEARFLGLVGD